jgi:hypothetical protein
MSIRILKIPVTLVLVFLFIHISIGDSRGNETDQNSIFDIESVIEMSIQADISYLIGNREFEELPAKVVLNFNNKRLELKGTVEVRGNFRRNSNNCEFPPLRLKFDDSEIKGTALDGNHNLKIVTHCRGKSNQFHQYMGKEFTVYQIYNVISPYSLRVKMVSITYIDEQNDIKSILNQAFLIEDIDNLADKNNMKEYDQKLSEDDIDPDFLLRLSIFQFMIGNTDWIIPLSKNLKFITDGEQYIPVPYDFDYTAIVDTDYSTRSSPFLLEPPVRKFKGPCYDIKNLQAEFEKFREKQESILVVISSSPYLKSGSRKNMKNYIEEFYDIINSEEKTGEYFQINCK